MPFDAKLYSGFWGALRAAHPGLNTGSGWKRKPTDIDRNYVGCRVAHYANIYVHASFRGRVVLVGWSSPPKPLMEVLPSGRLRRHG